MLLRIFALMALWMVFAVHGAEGDPQPIPKLEKRVTDLTATLSAVDEGRIEARLKEFEAQ